ncbi:MAG TPA: hypothetical protein VLC96_06500, partial [Flavobacterium sp.]|nr:hypothetical protein [Flavobacterium sp.]
MKKPTFSNLPYYLLSLLKSLFLTDLSNSSSSFKVQLCQRRLCFKTSFFSVNQFRAIVALVLFLFLHSSDVLGQNIVPFTPRYDKSIKGDMLLIGNNILNRDEGRKERPSDPFNADDQNNNDLNMQYIDVDSDNTTFSSSSARLTVPQASRSCYKVAYAAIYWAGIYDTPSVTSNSVNRNNLGKVKLKIPGQTTYSDITGTLIYDYYPNTSNGTQIPYAYYYDATALIKNLSSIEGDYTLANIISGRGTINGGFSAGWSLFVVYEDPNASAKYITSYDGFSWIQASSPPLSYDVTGFKTIPTGPVRAKLAFAALEGDVNIKNDSYFVNGTRISTADRPIDNFFNSTINTTAGAFTDRTPASGNTLGFETGIINLNNANNGIIANNDTKAKLELRTSGDGYGMFFNAFNVEIIEPKVVLTKIVQNSAGVDIGNQNVTLGQVLNYVIGLQNTGNDNATSVTIRDILPINTIFNYPADPSSISLPAGVTVKSYNAATREIVFDVDKSIVEVGDGVSNIRLRVQVVPSCNMLSDACSNSIDNQAFATYKGTLNPNFTISDDPSVNTNTGCLLTPKATNFLVGIDDCKFTKNEVLCGNSVVLTAANGYSSYKWSTAPFTKGGVTTGPIIGNSQTLTVTNPGTYYVYNTAIAPCLSITEEVTVTRFGGVTNNPIQKPVADQIVICPNDGKELPNIFLCGGDATRVIDISSVSAGSTVVWEKLNEASCAAVANPNCANESTSCTWTQVGTGSAYIANTSGQFRLTLNYPGGCFNRFYFNVYQNLLKPTETHRDIICNTKGNITVGGVGTGYEYSISNANGSTPTAYVSNNSFTINTAGLYTVFIRQIGVVNGCVFTIPNIQILQRNFNVSASVTQPLCFGERGSITVVANNGYPDYTYYLYDGATLVSSVGPISSPNHTFVDQTPGKSYRVRVTTADGCDSSQYPYINQPSSEVKATAAIVEPLTACSDGKIVVTAQGGNGPYQYLISGSTEYVSSGEFIITTPGTYSIQVVDRNNCNATATVTVPNNAKPTYDVNHTNSTCYGNGSQISIDNIVANGYSLSYSIDNGATFVTNPIFNNLYPGSYNVVVKYGITYMSQWNGQQTKYCTAPAVPITITGPTSAVTASGGVGELAGCSTSATGEPLGLLRITNVEGGNSPYSFSFDGGNTWQSSSEKYVPKGVYNLAVRDSNGCVFQIPYTVTLDPKPADPVIDDNVNTLYNCDGTATATVIVNNPASSGGTTYAYEYFMQKNKTGPIVPNSPIDSNVFTNVPSGNHNVIVQYNVKTVSSFSNLLQEDFGRGDDTTSPGINSAYCWE